MRILDLLTRYIDKAVRKRVLQALAENSAALIPETALTGPLLMLPYLSSACPNPSNSKDHIPSCPMHVLHAQNKRKNIVRTLPRDSTAARIRILAMPSRPCSLIPAWAPSRLSGNVLVSTDVVGHLPEGCAFQDQGPKATLRISIAWYVQTWRVILLS